jgi:2-aminoethylphosphonate-pyruvate transaminase
MPSPKNPYLLLTPGPLSTTASVKREMLRDWCTWDADYNTGVVEEIRARLCRLANAEDYTCALMQGSGTFAVESVIGSAIPPRGKLLAVINGAYGRRIATIAKTLGIATAELECKETSPPSARAVGRLLDADKKITHIAVVHCETTTGMLNPASQICAAARARGRVCILDAMSSFGGIPMRADEMSADFLISSANKCIQGVPGFGFVLARRRAIENIAGFARSHSLDLYGQWQTMERGGGKWRFTSPTHAVRAFLQALRELEKEGGVRARHKRYSQNHRVLVEGMRALGFKTLLADKLQSPFITAFLYPRRRDFVFMKFYGLLKKRGFVIYPGKVSGADTFRVGTIGDVYPEDMRRFIKAAGASMYWRG